MGLVKTRAKARYTFPIGSGLTPIARFNCVPWQRMEYGVAFKVGVVAFCKGGIDRVQFSVNGGAIESVSAMTLNDRTNTWEYWISITPNSHADISANGAVTITALVTGTDGGTKYAERSQNNESHDFDSSIARDRGIDLHKEDLTLTADYDGTLPQPEAWVSVTGGDDATGTVNDSGLPFATIGSAGEAIRAWNVAQGNGNTGAGGLIRLNVGIHTWNTGGQTTTVAGDADCEWMTVLPATGGDSSDTGITSQLTTMRWVRAKYQNLALTLTDATHGGVVYHIGFPITDGVDVWLDSCVGSGTGENLDGNNLINRTNGLNALITNCTISDLQGAAIRYFTTYVRNCTTTRHTRSALLNAPMVVNSTFDAGASLHGNNWVMQEGGYYDWQNLIYFGNKITEGHLNGWAIFRFNTVDNSLYDDRNWAFVNNHIEMTDPLSLNELGQEPSLGLMLDNVVHFLLWHNTIHYTGSLATVYPELLFYKHTQESELSITDSDIQGNVIDLLGGTTAGDDTRLSAEDNHIIQAGSWGLLYNAMNNSGSLTTGSAGLDASGVPTVGSTLRSRLSPLVPCDNAGNARSNPTDVGAYEYQP